MKFSFPYGPMFTNENEKSSLKFQNLILRKKTEKWSEDMVNTYHYTKFPLIWLMVAEKLRFKDGGANDDGRLRHGISSAWHSQPELRKKQNNVSILYYICSGQGEVSRVGTFK